MMNEVLRPKKLFTPKKLFISNLHCFSKMVNIGPTD